MDFLKRLRAARVSFHHSEHPVCLHDHSNGTVALPDMCKRLTPPYHPSLLLFSGHLQTIWAARMRTNPAIHYRRQVFESENDLYPGTFAVDFVESGDEASASSSTADPSLPPHTTYFGSANLPAASADRRPMLVVLHGVSGGSHEPYVKHVLAPLAAAGWEACVVISRGCGGSRLTGRMLYNARATWDVAQTVRFLRRRFPNRPLYAVGFSIGANILVNVSAAPREQRRDEIRARERLIRGELSGRSSI
ncbi:hypothetical protein SLS56_011683 [Neofusicoccum ribis]|uniref:AB hydrolase-1 domain-containing protein n=1 Tax=Neofusicoccum ribis TaxID=45134 RepID=A0ABR3SB21_9PEZI